MKNKNIPISKTFVSNKSINEVVKTLRSGWLVQGPKVKKFENEWSKFTGSKYSIAVNSCTSALLISLKSIELKKGDEVIVPAFTWISTANVVEQLQCKVIFCDIDLNTFNLDIEKLREKINKKTKAIIPVHLFGLPFEIQKIRRLQKKYKFEIIEDAACGFGSYIDNKHVGKFGITGCFSFHPRKAITTGEGGMVTTQSYKIAKKLIALRDHGAKLNDLARHKSNKPYVLSDHIEAGYNFRLTDIQASIAIDQMLFSKKIIEEKYKIANYYYKNLSKISWLKLPEVKKNLKHGYQSFVCLFQPEKITKKNINKIKLQRNNFMSYLQEKGISTRPGTHAVHMLSYYKHKYNIKPNDYFSARIANDCSISLPIFNKMKVNELKYIIQKINFYGNK